MGDAQDFDTWLSGVLASLGLDEEVYTGYISSILEEGVTSEDISSQVSAAVEMLEGVSDNPLPERFGETMGLRWKQNLAEIEASKAKQSHLAKSAIKEVLSKDRKEAEKAAQERKFEIEALKNRSRDDIREREKLLNEYGFQVSSQFDEDGNLIALKEDEDQTEDLAQRNSNKELGREVFKAQREASKAAHEKEQMRIKELKERERQKKEKAKQRTMKKEKRRGAG